MMFKGMSCGNWRQLYLAEGRVRLWAQLALFVVLYCSGRFLVMCLSCWEANTGGNLYRFLV